MFQFSLLLLHFWSPVGMGDNCKQFTITLLLYHYPLLILISVTQFFKLLLLSKDIKTCGKYMWHGFSRQYLMHNKNESVYDGIGVCFTSDSNNWCKCVIRIRNWNEQKALSRENLAPCSSSAMFMYPCRSTAKLQFQYLPSTLFAAFFQSLFAAKWHEYYYIMSCRDTL